MQDLWRLILGWAAFTAFAAGLSVAAADTIKTKDGETINGKVRAFELNHHSAANSKFVIDVDDETRIIPIHKIESIEFSEGGDNAPAATAASAMTVPQRPAKAAAGASPNDSTKESGDSGHWLTASSNKRHNSGCKYYKSSKGRPCGPNDGTPCKICGG